MIIDSSAVRRLSAENRATSASSMNSPPRRELDRRASPAGNWDRADGAARAAGEDDIGAFPSENGIQTVAFDDEHAAVALDAYSRFGKGRHPAALNFGDCCTYATASIAGEQLLCVGDDFGQTDLPLVSLKDADDPGYRQH